MNHGAFWLGTASTVCLLVSLVLHTLAEVEQFRWEIEREGSPETAEQGRRDQILWGRLSLVFTMSLLFSVVYGLLT